MSTAQTLKAASEGKPFSMHEMYEAQYHPMIRPYGHEVINRFLRNQQTKADCERLRLWASEVRNYDYN